MNGAAYMGLVAALPCAICGAKPVEVHHQRQGTGGGRRASDFDTMPLCVDHHRGPLGIHGLGTKLFPKTYAITEAEIVAQTRARLGVAAEAVEVWKQAVRDRRRKVPQSTRSKAAPAAARSPTRWPARKLASGSSFPTGAGRALRG